MDLDSSNTILGIIGGLLAVIAAGFGIMIKFLFPEIEKKFVKKEDFEGYKKAIRGDIDDLATRQTNAEKAYSTDHDILVRMEERIDWIVVELKAKRKSK